MPTFKNLVFNLQFTLKIVIFVLNIFWWTEKASKKSIFFRLMMFKNNFYARSKSFIDRAFSHIYNLNE